MDFLPTFSRLALRRIIRRHNQPIRDICITLNLQPIQRARKTRNHADIEIVAHGAVEVSRGMQYTRTAIRTIGAILSCSL